MYSFLLKIRKIDLINIQKIQHHIFKFPDKGLILNLKYLIKNSTVNKRILWMTFVILYLSLHTVGFTPIIFPIIYIYI